MPALLRASCWDLVILQTLKPLHLFHHSMPTSSLLGHLSASERLLVKGAKVIGLLASPLGSRSRSQWKSSQSTSTTSTAAGPVAVSGTLLNTTFSGILPGSSSSVLGSRYVDISPEWHSNVLSQARLASASFSLQVVYPCEVKEAILP